MIPFPGGEQPPEESPSTIEKALGEHIKYDNITFNYDHSTFLEVPPPDYTHNAQLIAINSQLDELLRMVRDHPETAQFVQSHLKTYLKNMRARLKDS